MPAILVVDDDAGQIGARWRLITFGAEDAGSGRPKDSQRQHGQYCEPAGEFEKRCPATAPVRGKSVHMVPCTLAFSS
jgi:hypothetical protein